jgi:predicted phage terminase large subunit-like protein
MIKTSDNKLIRDFSDLVDIVKSSTSIDPFESAADKYKRIKFLLSNYEAFCLYYFPEYCFAPFGWFHKQYPQFVADNPCNIFLEQWSREFAKSTHYLLFLPLFLKARGELTGMMVGSLTQDAAGEKLKDVQANLEANQRYINDFGEQQSWGDWQQGMFKTKDDVPFYAFGKDQSPRGTKFKFKRPNYGAIDDLNVARRLKNEAIAIEDKRWVLEELKPALWIKKWWLVVAQNRFHNNTVTALLEDAEDIKTIVHRVDMEDSKGHSNWPENFTDADCKNLRLTEGNGYIRERMNTPLEEGTIFKEEWMHWVDPLPYEKYDTVFVNYCDPSYRSTDKSDYKAWILIGKKGLHYHILKSWVEKASSKAMWEQAYDTDAAIGAANTIKHVMEANFIQEDIHSKELDRVAADKGNMLRVTMDHRAKPDKFQRIETLQPLFQRGLICFNAAEKGNIGMQRLRSQLLAFERGSNINDDAPDALEGAIWFIDRYGQKEARPIRSGKMKKKTYRSI